MTAMNKKNLNLLHAEYKTLHSLLVCSCEDKSLTQFIIIVAGLNKRYIIINEKLPYWGISSMSCGEKLSYHS
jgi:hypothetical protein